jgi:hypothetical protein
MTLIVKDEEGQDESHKGRQTRQSMMDKELKTNNHSRTKGVCCDFVFQSYCCFYGPKAETTLSGRNTVHTWQMTHTRVTKFSALATTQSTLIVSCTNKLHYDWTNAKLIDSDLVV